MWIRVVLPSPLGPRLPQRCPRFVPDSMALRATVRPSRFLRSRRVMTWSGSGGMVVPSERGNDAARGFPHAYRVAVPRSFNLPSNVVDRCD
jgi:hypothetical protein